MNARTIPITVNGKLADDPDRPLFDPARPALTYGPTLSRLMSDADARRYFDSQDTSREAGIIYLPIMVASDLPNTVRIDCLIDRLPPDVAPAIAAAAMQVAVTRLRQLHQIAEPPLHLMAIDEFDAGVHHTIAEQVVQQIRDRPPSPDDLSPRSGFTLSREDAIQIVMQALRVAPISARALASGAV